MQKNFVGFVALFLGWTGAHLFLINRPFRAVCYFAFGGFTFWMCVFSIVAHVRKEAELAENLKTHPYLGTFFLFLFFAYLFFPIVDAFKLFSMPNDEFESTYFPIRKSKLDSGKDLKEYYEMFEKGIISKEQFENIKKDIFN